MSGAPNPKPTPAQYLAAERFAPHRSEYFDGVAYAKAGGSREHNRIKENLVGELYARLKGSGCRTFSSDQRVLVQSTGLYAYPDVVVVCGDEEFDPSDRDTLINPRAVVEVLSPTTERYDRGAKFRNYQQIPGLVEYVLIAQDELVCERFVRQADGSWALTWSVGPDAVLSFSSIHAEVPLRDLYAGVAWESTKRRTDGDDRAIPKG